MCADLNKTVFVSWGSLVLEVEEDSARKQKGRKREYRFGFKWELNDFIQGFL